MQTHSQIIDSLAHCTVRIECNSPEGISTGTGFFFRFLENEKTNESCPCLVTNKHVIKGAKTAKLILSPESSPNVRSVNNHYIYEIHNFAQQFILHPDPNVDLAILPLPDIYDDLMNRDLSFHHVMLSKKNIPTKSYFDKMPTINDILMVGYPNGIWDFKHNLPIVRKGITATHPKLPYCGKSEFMIDAACFPGSSGSPVFLNNNIVFIDPEDNQIKFGTNIMLIGILYAGPQHTATGDIGIVNVPTVNKPVSISLIPNNLGNIIHVEKLLDFESILLSKLNLTT